MEDILLALIEAPTTLGNEAPGQEVMRQAFREVGLEPVDVPMDDEALRANPAAAPFAWDVTGKTNVVATWHPATNAGRSLILNGHVDVVPPEPLAQWRTPPFTAVRDGDWIYGRGAGDMKCGLAAIVGAVRGLKRLGVTPRAPVHLAVGRRGGVHRQRHAHLRDRRLHRRRSDHRRAVRQRHHDVAGRRALVPRRDPRSRRARGRGERRRERDRDVLPRDPAAPPSRVRAERQPAGAVRPLRAPDQPQRRRRSAAATGPRRLPASARSSCRIALYPGMHVA